MASEELSEEKREDSPITKNKIYWDQVLWVLSAVRQLSFLKYVNRFAGVQFLQDKYNVSHSGIQLQLQVLVPCDHQMQFFIAS
jgi:hypothetical protein